MNTDRPEPPAGDAPRDVVMPRRRFLSELIWGLSAIATLAVGIPIVGFLFAPLFRATPRRWRTVGTSDSFPVGTTTEVSFLDASPLPWAGVTARTAAWLRRESEGEFIAFSVHCTHLGCPVRWLPNAELFMCPCHGGVFYPNGEVAAGPPPRPLVRYPVRVQDGRVEILTSPIPVA